MIRSLWRAVRPYPLALTVLVVLQIAAAAAGLLLPDLNAQIIDRAVTAGSTGRVLGPALGMFGLAALQVVLAMGAVYAGARVALAAARDLRGSVFERVQELSCQEFTGFGSPSLLARTTNDVQQVQRVLIMVLAVVATAPATWIGGVVMAVRHDAQLSMVVLAVAPVLGALTTVVIRRIRPHSHAAQRGVDAVNRVVREQLGGMRVIRAFAKDAHEQERFARSNAVLTDATLGLARHTAVLLPLTTLVANFAGVAVLWLGAGRLADGTIRVGTLVALMSWLTQVFGASLLLVAVFVVAPRAEVCVRRIADVLAPRAGLDVPTRPVLALTRPGHLEVSGAAFRYGGAEEPVLHGVDLAASPGETVAVIGPTGSGKSTLLGLVPRLFDVTAGTVRVGGVDVRELDPELISRTVGLVPQKAHLFSGTVATNLRYGKEDATDAELWHALEVAQARTFVEGLDGGLDAPVSQGGTNVSGGQRQRLAIARALVGRPDIYLFDDAFSALDHVTEAALCAALAEETRDATVVLVSQRDSTVRRADRIVVLDEGRVVGEGSHEELMAGNATYRDIMGAQLTEAGTA
ncbi:ABC transporter ATP-binding protein/permease [Streptomyces sp. NBC_00249]|uniref:ABC transporter ATP-binding protein n=1 Tax=Streptomyces sp. NBC_00249 TaxID=2975690 RepID=UPI00224E5AED|nr:ABC transporter ATP-binding protein [Streptomyces sp. NBC_00249]MCX5192874.1 ABC transporter ATP-binding protein/permease [Streptomyces sp. NBC_00249]